MSKCEICGIECKGKTCSGSCRAKLSRRTVNSDQKRTRTVETEAHAQKRTHCEYLLVSGVKCYGRPAVKCSEFGTRPEPLNPYDKPVPLSRGRYVTEDNEVYQFDAVGNAFKCKQGLVYETLQDVNAANESRKQGAAC